MRVASGCAPSAASSASMASEKSCCASAARPRPKWVAAKVGSVSQNRREGLLGRRGAVLRQLDLTEAIARRCVGRLQLEDVGEAVGRRFELPLHLADVAAEIRAADVCRRVIRRMRETGERRVGELVGVVELAEQTDGVGTVAARRVHVIAQTLDERVLPGESLVVLCRHLGRVWQAKVINPRSGRWRRVAAKQPEGDPAESRQGDALRHGTGVCRFPPRAHCSERPRSR